MRPRARGEPARPPLRTAVENFCAKMSVPCSSSSPSCLKLAIILAKKRSCKIAFVASELSVLLTSFGFHAEGFQRLGCLILCSGRRQWPNFDGLVLFALVLLYKET